MVKLPTQRMPDGGHQIVYEHEWREDFVGEALTIQVDRETRIEVVEFYSADHGIVRWTPDGGLGEAYGWESPDAKSPDGTQARRQSALLRGEVSEGERNAVLEAVLKHDILQPIAALIRDLLRSGTRGLKLPKEFI